ncbi:hypothetical protein GN316_12310 [Xylophilus sp. Kf1]|nr:hypothetical protein [Xylophilus sp. Kf1]
MNRRVTDGALSSEEFEALSPHDQLLSLLDMIDRYIDASPSVDAWHAAKIRHALEKIEAGEVMAAAHDLALADQAEHGAPEIVNEDNSLKALGEKAKTARKRLMSAN